MLEDSQFAPGSINKTHDAPPEVDKPEKKIKMGSFVPAGLHMRITWSGGKAIDANPISMAF